MLIYSQPHSTTVCYNVKFMNSQLSCFKCFNYVCRKDLQKEICKHLFNPLMLEF